MSLVLDIKKRYPGFRLDMQLEAGEERVRCSGASGCGKSCTLRCIAGVETPDEGKIVVNGVTFFDSAAGINLSPQERKCALLFQNYQLFPNMTVADNVCAGVKDAATPRRVKNLPSATWASWPSRFCRPLSRAPLGRSAATCGACPYGGGSPGHLYVRRAHERTRFLS